MGDDDRRDTNIEAKSVKIEITPAPAAVTFVGTLDAVVNLAHHPTATKAAVAKLDELVDHDLYAAANDDVAVGSRIGVKDVEESTLKALAGYTWERRDRRAERERAYRRLRSERMWWIIGQAITVAIAVAGWIVATVG